MTPEQALRQAILADETGGARKAKAVRRTKREGRAAASFARRMAVRLLMLGLSLGGSAMMLFTEQGRAMRVEFQTAVLDVVQTELAARRAGPSEGVVAPQTQTGPEPEPAAAGISWLSAGTAEGNAGSNAAGKPKVNAMPESRVAIRRLGQ